MAASSPVKETARDLEADAEGTKPNTRVTKGQHPCHRPGVLRHHVARAVVAARRPLVGRRGPYKRATKAAHTTSYTARNTDGSRAPGCLVPDLRSSSAPHRSLS